MPNAARVLDKHQCPLQTPGTPPVPHAAGGVIMQGRLNVLIEEMPAARVGDPLLCAGPPPHPDTIAAGSRSVYIGGMPAARVGDPTASGGKIQLSAKRVLIG